MAHRRDPGYHRALSLHLARTLDEIGLCKLSVKMRRQTSLFREQMGNVYSRLTGANTTIYHFGSQTEGATTIGLKSDLDTLHCLKDVNVIEDWVDWKQGKMNLLMLHEDTAPGYCRLQLLRPDVPMARDDVVTEHDTYDSSGRVIFKNTFIHSVIAGFHERSGPARSISGGPGIMDNDHVCALSCRTWPAQASEFTRRRRRHGWPSQRLIEEATSFGVFLVPVGYKLSPTEPLEWRMSASMAERCLMFSLTIVHIKCYAVLKILVKTFIDRLIQKCISSYHCKTALLHCVETTEPCFWREDNIIPCIMRCLEILRNWVSDLFCPQYIISRENLFAGKVTVHNRDLLLSILTELIRSDGGALLQIKMDDLGHRLHARLNTEPSRVSILNSLDSAVLVGEFERVTHDYSSRLIQLYSIDCAERQHHLHLIQSACQNINTLRKMARRADKNERQALQSFINFLSCLLGSLLAPFSLSHNWRVSRQAIQLMRIAADYDVASMLKLASVFYCSGKFDKVEILLQAVEEHFRKHYMLVACVCRKKFTITPQEFCYMMLILKGKKARAKLFAHCVIFQRGEINCAPPALRHEMYRSVGDDIQYRHPSKDLWMVLAVVDCLPFLYYLQYLTYKHLRQHELQRRTLLNIDSCVRHGYDFRHLETAWNLLGQCLEDEQNPGAAMACYRVSLQIIPRNNAANWHVAVLWYKMVRNRGLLPGVAADNAEK